MTLSIFNESDQYVWIPVSNKSSSSTPRAFFPFKGIDSEYVYGFKADTSRAKYLDAIVDIQKSLIDNVTKVFTVDNGRKEELQKKAKWRQGANKGAPLLGPTLGWIKVPRLDLENLELHQLESNLIETAEGITYDIGTNYIEPVLCDTYEGLIEKAMELMPSLIGKIPTGQKKPKKNKTTSMGFLRDATVVAYVLEEAQGKCESCQKDAPFTKITGASFLEVHHVKLLSEGGSDTASNAIAVCPNCHREFHYGANQNLLKEQAYSNVSRLELE